MCVLWLRCVCVAPNWEAPCTHYSTSIYCHLQIRFSKSVRPTIIFTTSTVIGCADQINRYRIRVRCPTECCLRFFLPRRESRGGGRNKGTTENLVYINIVRRVSFCFFFFIYFYYYFYLLNKQSLSHRFIAATKRTRRGGRRGVYIHFIRFHPPW